MRISDWSSDVCSSDLGVAQAITDGYELPLAAGQLARLQQGPLHATWRCVALTPAIDSELLSQAIAALQQPHHALRRALSDRKRVVQGRRVSVRVELGGRRTINKNT